MFLSVFVRAAENDAPLLPPEQAFIAVAERLSDHVVVRWSIAPGYYVVSNKFSLTTESSGVRVASVSIPAGHLKEDKIFGQVEILRGQFAIELAFDVEFVEEVALTVISQGCSDIGICYPPYEQRLLVAALDPVSPDFSVLMPNSVEDGPFLHADRAFALRTRIREDGALVAHWEIAPGYYLYRDKLSVSAMPDSGYFVAALEVASGQNRWDEYFGEVEVFYDEVTVVVILKRINPVVVTSLAVEIVYQGCAEAGLCYPPITTSLAFDALP